LRSTASGFMISKVYLMILDLAFAAFSLP